MTFARTTTAEAQQFSGSPTRVTCPQSQWPQNHRQFHLIYAYQSTFGNQAVQFLLRSAIQPKLACNQRVDPKEQEADEVAEQIMRGALPSRTFEPLLPEHRFEEESPENTSFSCDDNRYSRQLQHIPGTADSCELAPEAVHATLRQSGQPMESAVRNFMESRFGRDFTNIRIHRDASAAHANREIGARAFATGHDLVFGDGQYSPATPSGLKLLAHELTHTIQQRGNPQMVYRAAPEKSKTTKPQPETRPLSESEAFQEFDHLVGQQTEEILAGIDKMPRTSFTFLYKEAVPERVVPLIRKMAAEAKTFADAGAKATNAADKTQKYKEAGNRYQAALICAKTVQLELNVVLVADYADSAGVPGFTAAAQVEAFDAKMFPLIEAALTFDLTKMSAALAAAVPQFQATAQLLDKAITDIGRNAELSRKVIAVADLLMLAITAYQISQMPTTGGGGGGEPPAFGTVYAGGTLGAIAIDMAALQRAIEAIRRLVAIGALDPAIMGAVSEIAGSKGSPIPELGKPEPLKMEGKAGGPKREVETGKPVQQGGEPAREAENAYIKALKRQFPKLKNVDIRPKARPVASRSEGAPASEFEERMKTTQGKFSLAVYEGGKQVAEFDGISVDGWIEEIKIQQRFGKVDDILAQLRRQAQFAEAYGLKGVRYSIDPPALASEVEARVAGERLRNTFRVE